MIFLKVYDCFTFYNEFELLELRLKALWDVVDFFVLVEADKTHADKPNPFYFWERKDEFKNFWPKIRHLPAEMTVDFKGAGDWSIENAQRDAIAYGIFDAAPDDLIMISDVDEIPAPDVIFNEVINRYAPDENIYLLEDDYLHLPDSRVAILEGLAIADYVTLYDHPDMYHPDGKVANFFVHDDMSKASIFLTAHTHWRSTVTATMTFAAKVQTLIEDRDVWKRFCVGKNPYDVGAFIVLTGQDDLNEAKRFIKIDAGSLARLVVENFFSERKKRLLISPLPAFATHTETNYLSPLIDWSRV